MREAVTYASAKGGPAMKWSVYKGNVLWVAHRDYLVEGFASWEEAFLFAYRHAVAAIHETP
jgi:hypothetical protein